MAEETDCTKTYTIKFELLVEARSDKYNCDPVGKVVSEVQIRCPACELRKRATELLAKAVTEFSASTVSGLAPIIATEPQVADAPERDVLTI